MNHCPVSGQSRTSSPCSARKRVTFRWSPATSTNSAGGGLPFAPRFGEVDHGGVALVTVHLRTAPGARRAPRWLASTSATKKSLKTIIGSSWSSTARISSAGSRRQGVGATSRCPVAARGRRHGSFGRARPRPRPRAMLSASSRSMTTLPRTLARDSGESGRAVVHGEGRLGELDAVGARDRGERHRPTSPVDGLTPSTPDSAPGSSSSARSTAAVAKSTLRPTRVAGTAKSPART